MGNIVAKGIVIKQVNYGEADRMLTIFTQEYGIIKAAARGVRRVKNRHSAAAQFLCYSDFELFAGNSDIATVNSITPIDAFFPICEDITKLSLFTYLADITLDAIQYSNPEDRVLSLFLNTLYLCAYKGIDVRVAKLVYELRFLSYIGYFPVMEVCYLCGSKEELSYINVKEGGVCCPKCSTKSKNCLYMSDDVYRTICYILYALDKKVFSFKIDNDVLTSAGKISEEYVKVHLERDFPSLDYYKSVLV